MRATYGVARWQASGGTVTWPFGRGDDLFSDELRSKPRKFSFVHRCYGLLGEVTQKFANYSALKFQGRIPVKDRG